MPASAVILSEDTYNRIMKMLEKWEKGQIVDLGEGLKNLETGTGYQKIGLDGVECTPVQMLRAILKNGKALLSKGKAVLTNSSPCHCGDCGGGGGATTGGCCVDGSCSVTTASACTGIYLGDGTTCVGVDCSKGACCDGGSCSITTPAACTGNFMGLGTTCGVVDCTQGACCSGGVCSITTEAGCSGTYLGGGSTCDSSILCGCACGFDAFDGSGRRFLKYTLVISGSATRHEHSDCSVGAFDTTEVYSCGGTYRQHYEPDCTLVTDENSIVSHAAITGTGGGFSCTRSDIQCFCSSVAPNILCTSIPIACQSCTDGNSGTDTTDTTAQSRTRTVVLSQSCQNDFFCPGGGHPAICTLSGSYTAIETLSDECVPA